MSTPSSATLPKPAIAGSLTASFDDLVFQYRNKEYGAYVVRQKYQKNTALALGIGTAIVLLILFAPMILSALKPKEEAIDASAFKKVTLEDVNKEDEKPQLPNEPPPPPPPAATVAYVAPKVEIDRNVTEEFVEIKKLDSAAISTVTQEGEKGGTNTFNPEETGKGPIEPVKPREDETIRTFAEIDASFPGGEGAMLKFLTENIYYPPAAKEAGIEGTVYVNFTVAKDGSLSDIKVKKGLGMGLDEAAIEGVKKMPKWTPARQNGNATRLSKTIPVKFKLNN